MRLPLTPLKITHVAAATLFATLVTLATPAAAQVDTAPETRDKAWWNGIAQAKYEVPEAIPLATLLDELTVMLASPDPELRDDIAYTTLAQWIYVKRVVPEAERIRLAQAWQANMRSGIGEEGTPTVLRRSFSALALGLIAGLDNEAPFLERSTFASILTSAVDYLQDEKDVRGFDGTMGWLHSVAHTADLLKFLARSRHLTTIEQSVILTAISSKMAAVQTPLIQGEDERLARVVVSIAARNDFDETAFTSFLAAVGPARPSGPPTEALLAQNQNRRHLLVTLYAVLSTDKRDLPSLAKARALVLERLR